MEPDSRGSAIHLKDYTPPHFKLLETRLEFFLHETRTQVVSELEIELIKREDLVLDGRELRLLSIEIDGEELAFGDISVDDTHLTINVDALPDRAFTLRTVVEINPSANTSLDGLYLSNGMYCTQCEAEGFRKITYYPDRPDVMTTFRVKVHSDLPTRLSNGNKVSDKKGVTEWHDPWPKPCYLFALVAGELEVVKDKFKTASGRKVDLQIFVRKGDETRCDYAMDALKRSMRWDEEAYGREYDLDLFMIVAVDDFNMGAMENKGLNIFNSKLVLASPETATDADYAAIESVIAHEYFHNWTGNRITCRDWFQLSLKEGLTVFRDQQFSAHERSPAVQRIEDVMALRARQFPEDASPLAHPVRPSSYEEINNFYTATIYEKGAELIGMLRGLVGADNYRKALDLYFERHDGQACTIEDWLSVFEDATGRDLSQFKLWYAQAGTPNVNVMTEHDGNAIHLSLTQELRQVGEQKPKAMLIPLKYSVLAKGGDVLDQGVIELTEAESKVAIAAPEGAQISLGQGFSAPIHLTQEPFDAAFFARFDNDPFNRFEALQKLALDVLVHGKKPQTYINILGEILEDETLDPAFTAHLLSLPGFNSILAASTRAGIIPDPSKIEKKVAGLRSKIGEALKDQFKTRYKALVDLDSLDISPEAASKRALTLTCLNGISASDETCRTAKSHYKNAKLMTDKIGALSILVKHEQGDAAVKSFYKDYQDERLLVDKWFAIQAAQTASKEALSKVQELAAHEAFMGANPNRWRSLMGGFAISNPAAFHAKNGKGYAFYADKLLEQDARNPQIAARMSVAFQNWREFDEDRQAKAKDALERLRASNISKNLSEMIGRMIG